MQTVRITAIVLGFACISAFGWMTHATELKVAWEFATPKYLPLAVVPDVQERPFVYVALKSGGLAVLDPSNSAETQRQVARVGIEKFEQMDVMNLSQNDNLLFLALGGHFSAQGTKHAGIAIVNVTNPRRPKVISVWKSAEKLKGAAVVVADSKFAFLGVMSSGVMTFDLTDLPKLRLVSTFRPDINFPRNKPGVVQHPNARGLAIRNNLLYVANDAGGLRVLNVKDHANPKEIGRYINKVMARKQQAYNNIIIDGNRAYLAIDYAGLEIVDISSPGNLRQIGWWNPWQAHTLKNLWFNSPGHTNQLVLDAARKLVYLSAGDSELQVVDVSKPASPQLVHSLGQPKNKLGVWGLGMSKNYVFLTYIKTAIPFKSTWAGVKAVKRPK